MDIARPSQARAKLKRRILIGSAIAVGLIGVTVVLARLKPAVPSVDRSLVWVDKVKRGPMVRQVHGPGTLVPVDIRWIAARTQGRVDRIVLLPGATVQPDSIIMVLSNPDVTQAAVDTQGKLEAGEAEFANLKYTVQASVLQSESDAAAAKALSETSRLTAQVDAGTKSENGKILTNGGRVLAVTSFGKNIHEAVASSNASIEKIGFEGKYYRKDIGYEFK